MIASYVRSIGRERATPAVIGQQLKILGFLKDGALSEAETLIVTTFVNVLTGIDAFDAAQAAREAAAASERAERRPVPIDETTMELVDGPLDTWGGKA